MRGTHDGADDEGHSDGQDEQRDSELVEQGDSRKNIGHRHSGSNQIIVHSKGNYGYYRRRRVSKKR